MLKVLGGEQEGEFKAVASGTLPNGKPVVVNSDGTVSAVGITDTAETAGTDVQFNAVTETPAVVYDSGNDKTVIMYRDTSNSSYQTAIVGTVDPSDNSISFGSEVVALSNSTYYHAGSYDPNSGNILFAYMDNGNSSYGTAVVGTVSGTSITFGTPVVFDSSETSEISITYDEVAEKHLIVYRDNGNTNTVTARVAIVSGTSVSFGAVEEISPTARAAFNCAYTSKAGETYRHCAIIYDYNSDAIQARTLRINADNTITQGNLSSVIKYIISGAYIVYDASAEVFVVSYRASGQNGYGKCKILTTSGASVTVGNESEYFVGSVTNGISSYDSAAGKIVITYRDNTNSSYGYLVNGEVNATKTGITFSTPIQFGDTQGASFTRQQAFDSTSNRTVIAYRDNLDSNSGKAVVYNPASSTPNLTAENYIGIAQGEAQVFPQSAGDLVEYHSTDTRGNNAVYDAASGKVVVIFNPAAPTSSPPSGYAIVGTVDPSDNSITYGTAVQFEDGEVYGDYMGITYDSNAEKVVIAYMDSGDSNNSKAIVGTVSGTSISFGTPTTFNGQTQHLTCAFDSTNNKVVIAYKDASNSDYGTAIVGTVSGTSISFGSKVVFNSGNTNNVGICFDSTNDKIIIGYRDQALNQQATAIVGTVSGTSISFGSEVQVSPNSATDCVPIYEPVADKVVFVYSDSSDSNKGTVKIGTVSGTSISFGDAVTFDATSYSKGAGIFDPTSGKVSISYKGASGYAYMTSGTVSGDTITFEDPLQLSTFETAGYRYGAAYDSANSRIVTAFIDSAAVPDTGESIVSQNGYEVRPSTADGNNVRLDIIGSISDNQFDLTAGEKYYVQSDGTLSTTAGSPSVLAGTAISSTELLVKT